MGESMQTHHFTLTITASAVAWYAAITSTVIAFVQTANYLRDRVRVKVKFQRGMETVGDPRYEGMTLTMITVSNTGRRPVTITNMGMMYLQNRGAVFPNSTPRIPCELTEGKYLTALINEKEMPFEKIRSFEAYDSAGRTFRKNFAPWRQRVFWYFRRKSGKT
jgi:hypothetical protein